MKQSFKERKSNTNRPEHSSIVEYLPSISMLRVLGSILSIENIDLV